MTSPASDNSHNGLGPEGFPSAPDRLKSDTIVEAVFEIQFDHSETPEVIVGQLARSSCWSGYQSSRQPAGNMPIDLLASDPTLKFSPTLQLDRPLPGEAIRIGPRVLSLNLQRPYPNWEGFAPRIDDLISSLYDVIERPFIHRLGLRYVNALTPAHGFSSLWDLTLDVRVRGAHPSDQVFTGYILERGDNTKIVVKVASDAFLSDMPVPGTVAFVDVDVQTSAAPGEAEPQQLREWVRRAHAQEKDAFFELWPDETIAAMRA